MLLSGACAAIVVARTGDATMVLCELFSASERRGNRDGDLYSTKKMPTCAESMEEKVLAGSEMEASWRGGR